MIIITLMPDSIRCFYQMMEYTVLTLGDFDRNPFHFTPLRNARGILIKIKSKEKAFYGKFLNFQSR